VNDGGSGRPDFLGDDAETLAGIAVEGPDDLAVELVDHGRRLQLSAILANIQSNVNIYLKYIDKWIFHAVIS
jgi:hypothetical protein